MSARRWVLGTGAATWVACVLACGGTGGGHGATGRDSEPGPTLAERVASARAARTAECKEELARADQKLEEAKSELADTKKRYRAAVIAVISGKRDAEFKKQIAELGKKVAELVKRQDAATRALRDAPTVDPTIEFSEIRVGQFGRLRVGSDSEPVFEVLQIVDGSNAILRHGEATYWADGLATGSLADGKRITIPHYVLCPGNRQYATAIGGTRTVLVLQIVRE